MTPSTVGLLLIAKNEGHVIGRALASGEALGVASMTVVVDDSTTDDTIEVARSHGANVIVRPYVGTIAGARNQAIALIRDRVDYVLMLDPDDVYEGRLPRVLEADVYDVWIHDDAMRFPRVQLFKAGSGVTYEGVRHERTVVPEGLTRATAEGLIYKRIGGGYQDSLGKRAKFMAHVRDLIAWTQDRPDDAHAVMMLAQSYRDAEEPEAARVHYERCIAMGGDDQERYLAAMEVAYLVEHNGGVVTEVTAAYLRAHEMGPLQAEPLFHLACFLRERGAVATAWHFARRAADLPMRAGVVILDVEIYQWKAIAELAVECWMLKDRAMADKLLTRLAGQEGAHAGWAEEQLAIVRTQDPPPREIPWGPSRALLSSRMYGS